MTRDLVEIHRRDMLAVADAHRSADLVAHGDGWSIVIVRRAVGSQLVRLGQAVTGDGHGQRIPVPTAATD